MDKSKQSSGENMQPWKPVREVLDLNDEGESIFGRKKPLVEKTLERIYAGLIKFVAGGKEAFIVKWNSINGKTGKYVPPSIDEPCPTVATQNRLGVAKVQFLSKQFGGDPAGKNISVEEPAGTITCRDHHAFVSAHYGNGYNTSVDAPTLTCKDRLGLVTSNFLDMQYGIGTPASTDKPAPAVTTNPKHNLVTSKFLTEYYGGSEHNHSLNVPCTTITTKVRHYLVNPQFASQGGSIDKLYQPCNNKNQGVYGSLWYCGHSYAYASYSRTKTHNGIPRRLHAHWDTDRTKEIYRQCRRGEYGACALRGFVQET